MGTFVHLCLSRRTKRYGLCFKEKMLGREEIRSTGLLGDQERSGTPVAQATETSLTSNVCVHEMNPGGNTVLESTETLPDRKVRVRLGAFPKVQGQPGQLS